jgi:hypothetical protein
MMLLYDFTADKYVREVVNEGGEDDEIVDSDGEVISLIFLSLSLPAGIFLTMKMLTGTRLWSY